MRVRCARSDRWLIAVTAQVHITSRKITSLARNTMLPDAATTIGCRNAEEALPPSAVSSVSSSGSSLSIRSVIAVIVSRVCASSENTSSITGIRISMKQTLRDSEDSASFSAPIVCSRMLVSSTGSMSESIVAPRPCSASPNAPSTPATASSAEIVPPEASASTASFTLIRRENPGISIPSSGEKSSPVTTSPTASCTRCADASVSSPSAMHGSRHSSAAAQTHLHRFT